MTEKKEKKGPEASGANVLYVHTSLVEKFVRMSSAFAQLARWILLITNIYII